MAAETEKAARARLFFALWPDDLVRRQLAAHQPAAGRLVAVEDLHITLVFLGSLDSERQQRVEEAAAGLLLPPFRLQLERLEYWRRPKVTWLGPSVQPPELVALHEQLKAVALAIGIEVEARPYQPHVTLARDAPAVPAQAIEPIQWDVTDFCLVESLARSSGPRYMVRRRWPLQAGVGRL